MSTQILILQLFCFVKGNGFSTALAALLLAWIFFKFSSWASKSKKNLRLPPGPMALPVIGNLHRLGKLPHRSLADLASKYGPIMFLRLGSVPTVVVSSAEMSKEILKTHDQKFASRPRMSFANNVLYDSSSLGFAAYGDYWKHIRKAVTSQLLGPKSLESLKSMRAQEMRAMVDGLTQHCNSPVNISELAFSVTTSMSCKMNLGINYSESRTGFNIIELVHEFFYIGGIFNIGDFIPWVNWMDVQGVNRRQKNLHRKFDAFLDKILEEHLQARARGEPMGDFTDELLGLMDHPEHKFTRDEVKANMLEMLFTAIDTSSLTTEWAMSELLAGPPSLMEKVQHELERVVGAGKKYVEESDLADLEYLRAVVKETLRVHLPVPLLLPRQATEDCQIGGYHIPRGCHVTVNAWAGARDPNAWGMDAELFRPERFVEETVDLDVKGQHFEVLPFGGGRRICPGMALGLKVVQLLLANLVHSFNWRLPNGMQARDLDMREEFGLSTPRAVPL
ncbi:hypothetical protein KI387_019624, partial [Taxus chinensis]